MSITLTKVEIPRSTWLRGEGSAKSYLLRVEDGKMCCLGNALLARGFTKEQILDVASPREVAKKSNSLSRLNGLATESARGESIYGHSAACWAMMESNDDLSLPDDEREATLIALAPQCGLEFSFTN